jgi:uncharacterized membrane protein YedE/YeeE
MCTFVYDVMNISGHGICGVARLNLRSVVACITFMIAGILTSTTLDQSHHTVFSFLRGSYPMVAPNLVSKFTSFLVIAALLRKGMDIYRTNQKGKDTTKDAASPTNEYSTLVEKNTTQDGNATEEEHLLAISKVPLAILSGALFATGLRVSLMVDNDKVLDFLNFALISQGSWDPSLIFVMGVGVVISAISYQYVSGYNYLVSSDKVFTSPIKGGPSFNIPSGLDIDANLLIGSVVFGVGWGIGGLCPGPDIYQAFVGQPQVLFVHIPCFIVGSIACENIQMFQQDK